MAFLQRIWGFFIISLLSIAAVIVVSCRPAPSGHEENKDSKKTTHDKPEMFIGIDKAKELSRESNLRGAKLEHDAAELKEE